MLPTNQDFVDWESHKKLKQSDTIDGKVETYDVEAHRSPTDQIYSLNSSTNTLTEKDLKNLRKLDLEILRNTIYARHGYAFKNKNARQFFDPVPWYVPTKDNVDKELTAIEKHNIALLQRLEKYATDNYDSYGR